MSRVKPLLSTLTSDHVNHHQNGPLSSSSQQSRTLPHSSHAPVQRPDHTVRCTTTAGPPQPGFLWGSFLTIMREHPAREDGPIWLMAREGTLSPGRRSTRLCISHLRDQGADTPARTVSLWSPSSFPAPTMTFHHQLGPVFKQHNQLWVKCSSTR